MLLFRLLVVMWLCVIEPSFLLYCFLLDCLVVCRRICFMRAYMFYHVSSVFFIFFPFAFCADPIFGFVKYYGYVRFYCRHGAMWDIRMCIIWAIPPNNGVSNDCFGPKIESVLNNLKIYLHRKTKFTQAKLPKKQSYII